MESSVCGVGLCSRGGRRLNSHCIKPQKISYGIKWMEGSASSVLRDTVRFNTLYNAVNAIVHFSLFAHL